MELESRIEACLSNLHKSTECFEMDVGKHRLPVGAYLTHLLRTPHVNLKSISFAGGEMLQYSGPQDLGSRAPNVKELIFTQTWIFDGALLRSLLIFLLSKLWYLTNANLLI